MWSLRSRLIALLLVISAAGLVALGAITYAEQRSFLTTRVDQQARAATDAAGHALGDADMSGTPRSGPARGTPDTVPSGTYGELRSASGGVVASAFLFSYDTTSAVARPRLPHDVRPGQILTVNTAGARYRVAVARDPQTGGLVLAAVPLREVDQTLQRLLVVEALVIGAVLALLGLVCWVVVRVGLRPLDRMGATAGAIAGGDLSRRVDDTDPRTEVGRLGRALNVMLDRLERAFAERQASEDRLRRFLADASHELRTPLASIRGYAELFRMGATRAPADVARAMERIEAESTRMGVLVEDLLMLARLDEVAETRHVDVDLNTLVEDAADDARAAAPGRTIILEDDGGPAVVEGDPDRLRQVMVNLLRNACVHTPEGTPIEIDLATAGPDVRVRVRDHGPGLPTADTGALFERFWRAEAGRERGRAGAGLGLAIVAAIVHGHGGRVTAVNAPGGGACFDVRLPAAAGAQAVSRQAATTISML